jgi:large repetitive protein
MLVKSLETAPLTPSNIPTLSFNTVISGAITTAGQQNYFEFAGTIGQQLFFDALGPYANLNIYIYDPSGQNIFGNNIAYDQNNNSALTLSANGAYKVVIEGAWYGPTGAYSFRFLDKASAPLASLDTNITGTFDNSGKGSVAYRFTVDQSQYLYVDAIAGNGSWTIYGPNGQQVATESLNYFYGDREFWVGAGEYFLVVRGQDASSTNYNLRLVTPELKTTPMTIGEVVSSSISEKGEQDTYTFTGTAGQQLFFDALKDYAAGTLQVTVYDPSGNYIFSNGTYYDHSNYSSLTLAANGTYRVVVDGDRETLGAYSFRFLDKTTAPLVQLDADITGNFDNEGKGSIPYRFSITQSQYLFVDASVENGNWVIYGPNGQQIAANSLHYLYGDSEFWVSPGEYFLVVRGQDASSTNYRLRLVTPELKTTPMMIGEVINTSISEKGEQDTYTFTGAIGQRLVLDELNSYVGSGIGFRLFSPSGKEILNTTLENSETHPLTLTETGSYRVLIDGYSETIGNYSFRLLDLENAIPVELDSTVSGQLNPGIATQLYKFSGSTGLRLYLDSLSNIPSTEWILYGSGNRIITQSQFSNDLEVILPNTDTYFLSIRGSHSSPVNYQFRLIPSGQSKTELTLGQLMTESLLKKGEQDTYTFNGQVGQKIFFDVVSGQSGIRSRLYSPTGVLVADLHSGIEAVALTLTEAGTYNVIVDGDGETTGAYSFLLSDRATTTELSLNTPIQGQLDTTGTPQLFTINGEVGQTFKFDINDADVNKINWVLYGDGNQVLHRANNGVSDFNFMLPSSGIHTLAVFNRGTAQTNYQFTVTDITPAKVETTGLDILIGETAFITRSGQITAGQVVEQTFTASAGKRIFLDSVDVDDNNVTISILNPNGTTLFSTSASQDAGIIQLSQSGTYKIRIQGATASSTGDYRFSVFEVLTEAPDFNDDVRRLSLNAEVTKTLDYGRSTHILSFQGAAGQRLFWVSTMPILMPS